VKVRDPCGRTRVEELAAATGVTPAVVRWPRARRTASACAGLRVGPVGNLGRLVIVGGRCVGGIRPGTEFVSVRPGLWVPETPHTSRDLLIFVEQSAEPVSPLNGVRVARCPRGESS
jgi:hypothetical protein